VASIHRSSLCLTAGVSERCCTTLRLCDGPFRWPYWHERNVWRRRHQFHYLVWIVLWRGRELESSRPREVYATEPRLASSNLNASQ
jgi:hypothetical protein